MSTVPVGTQASMAPMNMYETAFAASRPYYHQSQRVDALSLRQTAMAALHAAPHHCLRDEECYMHDPGDSTSSEEEEETSSSNNAVTMQRVDSNSDSLTGVQVTEATPPHSPPTTPISQPMTPPDTRFVPTPAANSLRRNESCDLLALGLTPCPCPGDRGVVYPNGARGKKYLEKRGYLLRSREGKMSSGETWLRWRLGRGMGRSLS